MSAIHYAGTTYLLNPGESVLACLLRHGIVYPHSCQAGLCQSCLIKGQGEIAPAWQTGVRDTLKAQGYFLACLAQPTHDLQVLPPLAHESTFPATIRALTSLNHNVIQVQLSVSDLAPWTPGQYLNLINPHGVIRSYSIANLPNQDGFIELHVKIQAQGQMSEWLKNQATIGDRVQLRGPLGQCFYFNPKGVTYDMLLAGTGTGLAPLVAIAKDALAQHHSGQITLLHGGRIPQDLYYQTELQALAHQHSHFHYHSCVLEPGPDQPSQPIEQELLNYLSNPKRLQVFICGPRDITQKLKLKAFCAGVPSASILSDAFT